MRSKRSTLVLLLCYKVILCLLVLLYYHTAKAHVRFLNGNSLEGYTTAGLPSLRASRNSEEEKMWLAPSLGSHLTAAQTGIQALHIQSKWSVLISLIPRVLVSVQR